MHNFDGGGNVFVESPDYFFDNRLKFCSQSKWKRNHKNTETLLQNSVTLIDADNADNDDPIERKIRQGKDHFQSDSTE